MPVTRMALRLQLTTAPPGTGEVLSGAGAPPGPHGDCVTCPSAGASCKAEPEREPLGDCVGCETAGASCTAEPEQDPPGYCVTRETAGAYSAVGDARSPGSTLELRAGAADCCSTAPARGCCTAVSEEESSCTVPARGSDDVAGRLTCDESQDSHGAGHGGREQRRGGEEGGSGMLDAQAGVHDSGVVPRGPPEGSGRAELLGEGKEEAVAREMERLHVHDVYDTIAPHFSATRFAVWPKARALPHHHVMVAFL